ncbi:photosynthetic complex assembly protein [Puniceibacterium antarcticum]|uniref:Photosynthetic complex assembly protein n=1 Tax=Puniceibacterium antarcticum TaxID=1206336 RepID=A0A2G8RHR6_9RHOB|nr:photosynthetic complex putative assembly protein PuhB [Puniceibacterium antarcticum]PIL21107.1 photosynthetic complex assembly protein [Puniceibacterium antarcticum]
MSHDDFASEPVLGLPETPPVGEKILWQGRPDWWALSKESLSLKWVAGYFGVLALWRFVSVIDLMPFGQAFGAAFPFVIMGGVVIAMLVIVGVVQARATVYTVTNRRVAMRIGAALTVTLNLPYTELGSADLALRKNGNGTIALSLLGKTQLSYLVCWPHVRPWYMKRTQPALRCIPEAAKIAEMIAEAAQARVTTPRVERRAPQMAALAAE